MKYLIQHRKEFAISAGFFIMTVISLVKAVMSKDITEDLIVTVIYAAFGVLAWFYNMPTSEENCRYTGMMRLEKEQKKGNITGENFMDEAHENPEVEHDDL